MTTPGASHPARWRWAAFSANSRTGVEFEPERRALGERPLRTRNGIRGCRVVPPDSGHWPASEGPLASMIVSTGRAGLARPTTFRAYNEMLRNNPALPAGRAPPLYVATMKLCGFVANYSGSPGRPFRPRGERCLDLARRVAPRLIAQPEEYPEAADSRRTSHYKVGSDKKCEVGEPVDSIPHPPLRRKHR